MEENMQAFIDPTTTVQYIQSWTAEKPYKPIWATYPNSGRVCQVEPDNKTFPIGLPYFWTPCADDVLADQFWYDTVNKVINPVENAPYPANDGVQSI
jgi:hypothetical protein